MLHLPSMSHDDVIQDPVPSGVDQRPPTLSDGTNSYTDEIARQERDEQTREPSFPYKTILP
jgi:hypothetical protein